MAETGLNYNYSREYDPATGRYIESDPIGLEGGMNTYGYGGSNPISTSDPSGLLVAIVGHTAAQFPLSLNGLGQLTTPKSGHLALWLEPDDPCSGNDVPARQTIGAQPSSGKLVTA
jgi:uncharacterized protein RhaS with RHS repeats